MNPRRRKPLHYGPEKFRPRKTARPFIFRSLILIADYAEFLFLSAFIFEMGIRMYALGVANFFGSSFNRFDTLVITCSVLEILWVHFHERADSFGFSALRALRLLRWVPYSCKQLCCCEACFIEHP